MPPEGCCFPVSVCVQTSRLLLASPLVGYRPCPRFFPKQCTISVCQFFLKSCPPLCYWRCPALGLPSFVSLHVSPKTVWGLRRCNLLMRRGSTPVISSLLPKHSRLSNICGNVCEALHGYMVSLRDCVVSSLCCSEFCKDEGHLTACVVVSETCRSSHEGVTSHAINPNVWNLGTYCRGSGRSRSE